MEDKKLSDLKLEIKLKAKSGIDFVLAASVIWLIIFYIWTLEYSSYDKSVFTFIVGGMLLPMALGLSKILKTTWKIKNNSLQPLGLWLNFAQLIYFPFLIFILIKSPDYFIMTYAIITGAHLFPYAWFYDEMAYAVLAVIISFGTLLITFNIMVEQIWIIPLFTSAMLFILAFSIFINTNKLSK